MITTFPCNVFLDRKFERDMVKILYAIIGKISLGILQKYIMVYSSARLSVVLKMISTIGIEIQSFHTITS